MALDKQQQKGRGLERLFLFLVSVVLGLFFYDLYNVTKRDFAEVPGRLADGSIVNLNADNVDKRIQALLEKGYYFEDPRDINVITAAVAQGLSVQDEEIDNIGELNKQKYYVDAQQAYNLGGESFKKRVKLSRTLLGFAGPDSNRFAQELKAPPRLPATNELGTGSQSIKGTIYNKQGKPVQGVLMRLDMLVPQDSAYSNSVEDVDKETVVASTGIRRVYVLDSAGNRQLVSLSAYARTDEKGVYAFTGLPSGKAFEVLPLQPGFQFGASKGVQALNENTIFNFTQAPHKIRLLSSKDFNNLKRERSLIVRTPEEASKWYWIIIGVFFTGFIFLHIFLSWKLPQADQLVLPTVMLLTGISLLTLLSLQDPLRDRFLARSTLWYFVIGFIGMFILQLFNLRRFTVDSGLYRLFAFRNNPKAAKGWQWAGVAITLLILTILLGSGPEGSGVKVNLFGFQPSEVVKFLIVVFLAGFFSMNEKFISEYATMKKRWGFFYIALGAILASILLFLMLGDLGPAIVVCFTFIILFSFSRGDFDYTIGGVVLFVLANWAIKNVWLATVATAVLLALAMLFHRKQLSESAVMALVVIASFLLLDQIPFIGDVFSGPVQRLVDRKLIWIDKWDNDVFGGDQVANGIWAMASGGITGQGIGEGFGKTIPEAHTDMILPALGEELGLVGIITVFILFVIYLHRSIVIGRQTGTPFLFYLCAGIGVSTFVQFLLIAGGSVGALPLSGVSLPFISYGGSSLVCNLLAAGFLLSSSVVQGTAVQLRYVSRQQDRNLIPALIAAFIGVLLLGINVSRYLFQNDKWVVQPALVAERSGARMFSYNPRIAILMNRLQAGTLYDRTGKILATSKPELVTQQQDSLRVAGLNPAYLQKLSHRRLDRYYPFAEHMFFWTGDANTGVFYGGTNGYFAEYELGPELRGFETPITAYNVTAGRYREDRFLPQTVREMTVAKRDYSVLAPLLLAGINSKEVEAFKQRNRDVQLSMDATLQTGIQTALQADDSLRNNRISVVVLDDSTGDVLTSAAYPLPPVQDWDQLTLSVREQNKLGYWLTATDLGFTYATQPGSTAKILTALAAFNKLGEAAAKRSFLIRPQDLIRVKGAEPDETGTINMERAIVKSNNSYFIKLANEERLQEQMGDLYIQTGMFLRGVGGYFYGKDTTNEEQENRWRALWRKTEFQSVNSYNKNDIRKTRGRGVSGMAWGQGELIATPAAVARLVAGVANGGVIVPHRFVLKISDSTIQTQRGMSIVKEPVYADYLTDYMVKQSANKVNRLGIKVAGKTGTPERIIRGRRINDGWYTFFAPKAQGGGHIVVCIRIEDTKGSSNAVALAGKHIIPQLLKQGYIKGFESTKPSTPE
ncbi:FtsW/RodA/SpoVE family cell cycle protein [Flavisolibacter tropicus]|uniref:Cell cycle protein n=1 Tax=Flavisolibacter tropicus TaxID=1492898 RepID=A0A172U121_9BACT|nr:FtsW/RodA/SpoVE family cell cycle protein [Flavisolibacter tropicus]ANE52723.1 cell cycle protein [Flavisolibacter tropicus]